ncbi:hypothetical protein ACWGOK_39180 [Streptomyces eurythermus]
MSDSITIDCGAGATMTVTAHPTTTPGLIVHGLGPLSDKWRLTHQQSGSALGEFRKYQDAQDAAAALHKTADWTVGPEAMHGEQVLWVAIDAIEAAGGRFLYRPGGFGERVMEKRTVSLVAQCALGAGE